MERVLVISSQLSNINKVRNFLEEIFADANLDRKDFNRVFLGLSEVVNNSIIHGNSQDIEKRVCIRIFYFKPLLIVEVKDEGDGFLPDQLKDPTCFENLRRENGRGIYILKQVADEVLFSEGGCKVSIKFKLNS